MSPTFSARTLGGLWRHAVEAFAERPALEADGEVFTFADVDAAADRIAGALAGCGIEVGEPVVIALPRGSAWVPALLGTWKAGGVAVPTLTDDASVARAAGLTGARLRIRSGELGMGVWGAVTGTGPSSGAWRTWSRPTHAYAMATSGSTGDPKLALVTHTTSAAVLAGIAREVELAPDDHALHTASFTFSSSIRQLMVPLCSGARISVLAALSPLDPTTLLAAASRGVTTLDLTPTHVAALCRWAERESVTPNLDLRHLLVASETFTPALLRRWRDAFGSDHQVFHLYGQTETGGAMSVLAVDGEHHDRLPLRLPAAPLVAHLEPSTGNAVRLYLDGLHPDDGMLVDGVLVRDRYEVPVGGTGGLYDTGDLVTVGSDGSMFFHHRSDAEVKILGTRVDLASIEHELGSLLAVDRIVVTTVDRPNSVGGASLCVAFSRSSTARDDIHEALSSRIAALAPVGTPVVVELDELPTTVSGKVDRAAVQALLCEGTTTERPDDVLAALWNEHTSVAGVGRAATVDEDADFYRSGGDSLSLVGLLAGVEEQLGVRVELDDFLQEPTLAALRRAVGDRRRGKAKPTVRVHRVPTRAPVSRPATALQEALWVGEQLWADTSRYWLPVVIEVDAMIDRGRLTAAFRSVLARYDALRLSFVVEDDGSLAMRPDAFDPDVVVVGPLSPPAPLTGMAGAEPLVCVALATGGGTSMITVTVHHAVADRRSVEMLVRALAAAYTGTRCDPEPAPSFLDWSDRLPAPGDAAYERARHHWGQLLPLPETAAARPGGSPEMRRLTTSVPLIGVPPSTPGATRHARWLTAFHGALRRAGAPSATLIGVDVDQRRPADGDVFGPCVTTLPVVLDSGVAEDATACAATEQIARSLQHALVPLGRVVAPARRPLRDPRQPFFRHRLVHQRSAYPELTFDGHVASYRKLPPGILENTVTLFVREHPERVDLELGWDANALDASTAAAMLSDVTASWQHTARQAAT